MAIIKFRKIKNKLHTHEAATGVHTKAFFISFFSS